MGNKLSFLRRSDHKKHEKSHTKHENSQVNAQAVKGAGGKTAPPLQREPIGLTLPGEGQSPRPCSGGSPSNQLSGSFVSISSYKPSLQASSSVAQSMRLVPSTPATSPRASIHQPIRKHPRQKQQPPREQKSSYSPPKRWTWTYSWDTSPEGGYIPYRFQGKYRRRWRREYQTWKRAERQRFKARREEVERQKGARRVQWEQWQKEKERSRCGR